MSLSDYLWRQLILQTVRVWFTANPNFPPEDVVWHRSFDNVVKVIVSLPCQREHEELVELVVHESDAERVRRQFNVERSVPLGDRDPMVRAQEQKPFVLKRFEAGQKLRETYLTCQQKGNFCGQVRNWFDRRLQWIAEELGKLLNSIQVCPVSDSCTDY